MNSDIEKEIYKKALRAAYEEMLMVYETYTSEEQRIFDIGEVFGIIKLALHANTDLQECLRYMAGGADNEPDTV